MDKIKELYDLCETVSDAIEEANKKIRSGGGKLSGSDVDYVDKLTHTLKSLKTTIAMMESEGYSGYTPWAYDGRSYRMRDSRGRYSGTGYSRDGLADKLRELMDEAPDEHTRMEIKRLIDKM